jgi:spore germination cell wall hydrolase CwlJ-like protein
MTPMMCMAIAIFFEARDQEYDGKLAVGFVIETRVESSRFPDDVCSVVNQPKAFSYTHDGLSDNPEMYDTHFDQLAWEVSQRAAHVIMSENTDFTISATHYHASWMDTFPKWAPKIEFVGEVGDHLFYYE